MKKLLFISLFFISCKYDYAQITITKVTSAEHACSGAGVVGTQHNNIAFDEGSLYLAVVFSDSSTNYGNNIGSTSFTWDTVLQIQSHTRRIEVLRCMPTSSTTTDDPLKNFSFGSYPNNIDFIIYKITGVPLGDNGANAIVQVAVDSATGANPTISTMSSIPSNAGVMALFINNSSSTFSGTPESGWTESFDNGCITFPAAVYKDGTYVEYRVNTSDNTPSVTAASSDWIGAAIELKSSLRRIIITN